MTTQDETILRNGQNNAQAAAAVLNEATTDQSKTARWQTVTIGGMAGIAMGAAASQLYKNLTADSDETVELIDDADAGTETATEATVTEVNQATVGQELSFADAFAAARAEVGPGGVFLWHGQLYNTYTAEEWHGMSDAEKDEFAAEVQPYLGQQTTQVHHTAHTTTHVEVNEPHDVNVQQTSHIEGPATDELEVHFLGVESREVEGQTVNVGHMTINDVNVALVDMDDDQVFDIRLMDSNRNGELEDNEITDISDRGLTVEDFQMAVALEEATGGQPEQTIAQQEDLAPEMPDYMNDAEVDIA